MRNYPKIKLIILDILPARITIKIRGKMMKIWVKIFATFIILFVSICDAKAKEEMSDNGQDKIVFINPIFYQNLSSKNYFYVLTPDSKFFESAEVTNSVKCSLLTNEENHISLICNDCTDGICSKKAQYIHDFTLSKNEQNDGVYNVKHEVTDKNGNFVFREDLITDGFLLQRRPDLL